MAKAKTPPVQPSLPPTADVPVAAVAYTPAVLEQPTTVTVCVARTCPHSTIRSGGMLFSRQPLQVHYTDPRLSEWRTNPWLEVS